jgi:alpha-glucoside transport system substrate-binding protein
MRSSTRALVVAAAALLTAVGCGASSTQSAGTVHVLAAWTGADQASFMAVIKPFEASTGIKVQYEANPAVDATLTTRVAAGNVPDLAAGPSPQLLAQLVKQGKVIALDDKIDMKALKANYSKTWIDLGSVNGKLYQVYSWAAVKGLVWYDPKNFAAKSFNVPRSWDDLINLQATIKANGTTPWCIAVENGTASGSAGGDWVKEIVLNQSGPTVYDNWWQGKQSWASPEIKSAWKAWGTILGPNDSNVYGGKQMILSTKVTDGATPMFRNPPLCYMHNQASFITSFFTSANSSLQPVSDFNFFPLPEISQNAGAHVVTADSWSMFKNTSQARQLIQYLTTAEAQTIWVKRGGKISPNQLTSINAYPDVLSKEAAQILASTRIAKFDTDDQMPAAMTTAYWKAVLDFVTDQTKLDSILANLDKTQRMAYT